jgi:acyl-CoA reductase-like NAD-dependent aldehyde dehydrogenase
MYNCRAAESGHAAAKRRLAASQAAIRSHAEELAQAAAAEQERRRQALLSLKSKIDEVRENVGQKADRFRCGTVLI